jgi:hypothetical protein
MKNYKLEKLQNGETFITSEKGNSMVPLIHSGQEHKLSPASVEDVEVGDIVYCKVNGKFYTHLVEVREKTGAGYMQCMKGLAMCGGNVEKAVEWVKQHPGLFDYV